RERTINISPLRGEATRPDANQRLDRLVRGRPLLLNGRTLRREYLPASVALDEHVRKARPSVNRLSLVVASFHMVDSRHDRSVSFNSHVQIRKFKRIEHSLVGLHLGEHFVLRLYRAGATADVCSILGIVALKPRDILVLVGIVPFALDVEQLPTVIQRAT